MQVALQIADCGDSQAAANGCNISNPKTFFQGKDRLLFSWGSSRRLLAISTSQGVLPKAACIRKWAAPTCSGSLGSMQDLSLL
eukprot:867429-Pelagomonas_calceolata.AAC.2